ATSFAFRLHPVGAILGGVLVHPMRRARELLRFYGKFVEGAPDELTLFAALGTSPDGVPVAVILAGYFGPLDEGERILRPIREFGPPILDDIKRMSYVDLQGILGPAYPPGARNYWKSGFLANLGEEAIDTMIRHAESVPSKRTQVVLEYLGGAVTRVGERDTAFGHRDARFDLVITSIWSDPAEDETNITWTRDFWDAMEPFASGRDRRAVRLHDLRQPDQRREHREATRDGVVEARQLSVDRSDGISRTDEETGESLSRSHPVRRPGRLERADDGGPDGHDAVSA